MKRTSTLLLLIALGIAAEGDNPTPTPAVAPEVVPAAAPEVIPAAGEPAPVAPAAAAAATAEAMPSATTAPPPPAARRRAGVRVARVAGAPPEWDGRLRLGAGYDSNALLESNPDEVQSKTATYNTEGSVGWRPVANERDFLKATGTIAYDRRPGLDELDTSKLALGVAGARQGDSLTTGGSLSAARYWLDGDGAAAELRGGASLGWLRTESADLLALELALIHFNESTDRPPGAEGLFDLGDADDRSGALTALAWRHWWRLGDGARIEVATRAGRYFANSEMENYALVQPWLAVRFKPGAWDLQARASIEGRNYDAERAAGEGAEQTLIAALTGSADRNIGHGLWAGVYAALGARDSTYDDRDYERWQAGVRLTWTIAAQE